MAIEINLLHKHKTSKFIQRFILIIRVTTVVVGASVLLSLAGLFILKKNVEIELENQTKYQDELMTRILRNQDKETAALLLNAKYKEINALLKAEPPYLTYYETLMRELPNSSDSGKLTNLSIQENGSVAAQVVFPNILAMTKFLSHVESESFQKNFTTVRTSGVSFSQEGTKEIIFSLDVKF